MPGLIKIIAACLFISGFLGCKNESPLPYSFFVAGHVYGSPENTQPGIYPPFKAKFEFINQIENLEFGVFTGDMVKGSTKERWDVLTDEISELKVPVHFAVGNHELERYPDYYKSRFGETYYSFTKNEDLFIFLNPFDDNWNISGKQLVFLKETLKKHTPKSKNIFVLFHQLLWWSSDNQFKNIKPNWTGHRAEEINFQSEIIPLFEKLKKPVFMIAGDIGARRGESAFMYHQNENLTFIASGMGGGTQDNFVVINIDSDKKVSFELIALNGMDTIALGELENFQLP